MNSGHIKIVVFICLSFVACSPNESKIDCKLNAEFSEAKIYQPCKEFEFIAKYWFDGVLVSDEVVSIFMTGNPWEYSSEQMEAILIYKTKHSEKSIERIRSFGINPEINDRDWVGQEATGIIEDGRFLFHHPFRHNQYIFTEVAPFPEVVYPIYLNKTWSGTMNISAGWGIWNKNSVDNSYHIVDQEPISINGVTYNDCWKIAASCTSDFGVSYLTTWFHEEFGFVKLNYISYAGQVLQFELNRIINH